MAEEKRLVFTFGRFNPPTTGHKTLLDALKKVAGKDDYWIFPSHTQDKKKNPLDFKTKVGWMKKMYFTHQGNIWDQNPDLKTAFKVCEHFQGTYQHICMVVGSDRVEAFRDRLTKANGNTHTFKTITVTDAGLPARIKQSKELDDYDIFDDTDSMSGSLMREFAEHVKTTQFLLGTRGLLNTWDSLQLMQDVRKGLNL